MKSWVKIVGGLAVVAAGVVGAICLSKKHNDDADDAVVELTDENCDEDSTEEEE